MPIWFEGPSTPAFLSQGPQVHMTVTYLSRVSLASEGSYRPGHPPPMEQTPSLGRQLRKEAQARPSFPAGRSSLPAALCMP